MTLNITACGGRVAFCTDDSFEEKLETIESDYDDNGNTTLSCSQIFSMLRALPKGVKWNPYTEKFENYA